MYSKILSVYKFIVLDYKLDLQWKTASKKVQRPVIAKLHHTGITVQNSAVLTFKFVWRR